MVCTGCCATLDNIITYLFRRLVNKKKKNPNQVPDSEAFLRILELHPDILQQVCYIFYTDFIFGVRTNQFSFQYNKSTNAGLISFGNKSYFIVTVFH